MDPSTGLQYDQARFYDPTTGSFLTRDPLEAISGQPYIYAADDPTSLTDPTGLISIGFDPTAGLDALVNIGRGASFGLTDTIANWISPGASCTVPQNTAEQLLGGAASGVATGDLVGKLAQGLATEDGPFLPDEYYDAKENGLAPGQSAPYSTYERFGPNGELNQVTTYDRYGDRANQYDLGDGARHGEGAHSFEYDQNNPRQAPGGGIRGPHVPFQ